MNVLETSVGKIVEVHQAVRKPEVPEGVEQHFGLSTARRILYGKPNFLKRDASMLIRAEHFRISLLECAKQAAFSGGLIVAADSIVVTIPGRRVFQKRIGALKNPQIGLGNGLLSRLHTELPTDPAPDDDDANDDGARQNEPPPGATSRVHRAPISTSATLFTPLSAITMFFPSSVVLMLRTTPPPPGMIQL